MQSIIYSGLHAGKASSTMEWPGCRSQRFRGGKHQYSRSVHFDPGIHFRHSGSFIANDLPLINSGRRHYEEIESGKLNLVEKRTGIRHIDRPSETIDLVERPHGPRHINFEPSGVKDRPERLHIAGGEESDKRVSK